jgi:hypothetical protein
VFKDWSLYGAVKGRRSFEGVIRDVAGIWLRGGDLLVFGTGRPKRPMTAGGALAVSSSRVFTVGLFALRRGAGITGFSNSVRLFCSIIAAAGRLATETSPLCGALAGISGFGFPVAFGLCSSGAIDCTESVR